MECDKASATQKSQERMAFNKKTKNQILIFVLNIAFDSHKSKPIDFLMVLTLVISCDPKWTKDFIFSLSLPLYNFVFIDF